METGIPNPEKNDEAPTNLDLLLSSLASGSLSHQLVQTYSKASPENAKAMLNELLKNELQRRLERKHEAKTDAAD